MNDVLRQCSGQLKAGADIQRGRAKQQLTSETRMGSVRRAIGNELKGERDRMLADHKQRMRSLLAPAASLPLTVAVSGAVVEAQTVPTTTRADG